MNKKTYSYILVGVVVVVACGVLLLRSGNSFEITKSGVGAILGSSKNNSIGPITGTDCLNASNRPVAVMISSDPEARPLSAIGQADIVFEMPVTPNGVTRMMAVFQCERPKEIGSVRSARSDFVPLALGLNTIYAHFGGEHDVLAKLNAGVTDNIDGLLYDGTTYYRKKGIPRPHNAFTDLNLIAEKIKDLKYESTGKVSGYLHDSKYEKRGSVQPPALYGGMFAVSWKYDLSTNSYSRTRNNRPEIDKNSNKQVSIANVIVMETTWSPISLDYLRIKTVGSGKATIYKNGEAVTGTWEKKSDKDKLYFYDINRKEIKFTSGKIWVEIVI